MRFFLSGPRILGIRPGILFRPEELFQKPARIAAPSRGGFVYVIRSETGTLKVGVSNDPTARLAQLQTGSPFPLTLEYVGALRCDGYAIEGAAHGTLARHRLEGEWFNCPVSMAVAAIGAAAHSLGEPIASVDPSRVGEVVRAVAMTNQAETQKSDWFIWLLCGALIAAIVFFLILAQSP